MSPKSPSRSTSPARRPGNLAGIALVLAATALFACSDALSKQLATSLPPIEIAWLRWTGFVGLMLPVTLWTRGRVWRSGAPLLQVSRSLALLGSAVIFITALGMLPMATATATSFVSPLMVSALSIPMLGERVGLRRWAAIAAGLVGVLVVVRPGVGDFGPATLLPLLSAFAWALAVVFTRQSRGIDGPLTAMSYTAVIGFVALSVLIPFVWVTPGWRDLALVMPMAMASSAAQLLTVLAYHRAQASALAPFTYTQIVWSIVLGYLLFANAPDLGTMVGTVIIVASGIYTAHRESRRARVDA